MSQLFRQQRQAAHEGATNSENVKVHTGLFYLSNRVKCTHLAGLVQPERYTRSGVVGDSELQGRSEEHTSELQSRGHLVCRLLLEKKKRYIYKTTESDYYKQRQKK